MMICCLSAPVDDDVVCERWNCPCAGSVIKRNRELGHRDDKRSLHQNTQHTHRLTGNILRNIVSS